MSSVESSIKPASIGNEMCAYLRFIKRAVDRSGSSDPKWPHGRSMLVFA